MNNFSLSHPTTPPRLQTRNGYFIRLKRDRALIGGPDTMQKTKRVYGSPPWSNKAGPVQVWT